MLYNVTLEGLDLNELEELMTIIADHAGGHTFELVKILPAGAGL